jgi:anthranilate phosphoribosyltransferase
MIREALESLVMRRDLSEAEAAVAMEEIMEGRATPALLGAFLVALRMKGETAEEVAGFARTMRAKALRVEPPGQVVDTCGTGGDGQGTFNISTAAAFVAAGAGVAVAKHGNRAASSKCGSADVLEAAGVKIDLTPEQVRACLEEVGIGFMFAPAFHPAMRHAAPTRRELGIATVFNILGPLCNPAGAQHQVLGVARSQLVEVISEALLRLGAAHVLVVHSQDGVDELTLSAPSVVSELRNGKLRRYTVEPEALGLAQAPLAALRGGSAEENAAALRRVLEGAPGPLRDVVLLNAAAALVAGDRVGDLREGLELARASVDSGAALAKLEGLIKVSQRFATVSA